MIKVMAAIYGGERFSFDGASLVDNGKHLTGFCLDKDGKLKASGADISGHIEATSAKFTGKLEANVSLQNSTFTYPMYGAVRGFIVFKPDDGVQTTGVITVQVSEGIAGIERTGVGSYRINLGPDTPEKRYLSNYCLLTGNFIYPMNESGSGGVWGAGKIEKFWGSVENGNAYIPFTTYNINRVAKDYLINILAIIM